MTRPSKLATALAICADEKLAAERGVAVTHNKGQLLSLIRQGWQETYIAAFGAFFVDGLAPHHIEAIEWHWNARIAFLTGTHPEFDAYFPIWSRAHNKSGVARRIAVMDGILSYAYNTPAYILYISRNKDMVLKHAKSIETLLQSDRIKKLCPKIAEEQINDQKRHKGWTAKFLYTAANIIFHFAGLDEGMAGGNLETDTGDPDKASDVRVTLFVPDDIDGREDSPTIAETRFNTLTNEVLPMGQDNTLTFFAQNLISRFSTMYRIHTQQARVLTGRKSTKPVPAVINLKTEERTTDDGIIQDVYLSGEPTWKVWDAKRIQQEINRFGLQAFLRECQHEVEQSREGLFHKKYDDSVHPISYSQFEAVYGARDAWKSWFKVVASDWARTKTRFHANVAGYLAVSSQNTKYPGLSFLIPYSFGADTQPEDVAIRLLSELTPNAYTNGLNRVTWKELAEDAWKRINGDSHYETVSDRLAFRGSVYNQLIASHAQKVLSAYRVDMGVNSHSEDKVRSMLNFGFGFNFIASNPGKTDALEDIEAAMRVDYDADHLFRSGKGYTRWYVLCPDDPKGEMAVINGVTTYPPVKSPTDLSPDNLHDSDLFRYQMMNRRFRDPTLTVSGEMIDEPEKTNDDFGQMLQMIYYKQLLTNIPLTKQEVFHEAMPDHFKESEMDEVTKVQKQLWMQNYGQEEQNAETQRRLRPFGNAPTIGRSIDRAFNRRR